MNDWNGTESTADDQALSLTPDTPEEIEGSKPRRFWTKYRIMMAVIIIPLSLFALYMFVRMPNEVPQVEAILTSLMQTMRNRDSAGAAALFIARDGLNPEDLNLDPMLEGNNYNLFEGFQSLTVDEMTLSFMAASDPSMPQGTVAEVVASVAYGDGYAGTLEATLEKLNDVWRLYDFTVTVPEEMLNP